MDSFDIMVVFHYFTENSENSIHDVNETHIFGSLNWIFSGRNGLSEMVVPFFVLHCLHQF